MRGVKDALSRMTTDLSSAGRGFALVGGLAVSVRTEPRFTQDVDLAVATTDDTAAEQTVNGLIGGGYDVVTTVEHDC